MNELHSLNCKNRPSSWSIETAQVSSSPVSWLIGFWTASRSSTASSPLNGPRTASARLSSWTILSARERKICRSFIWDIGCKAVRKWTTKRSINHLKCLIPKAGARLSRPGIRTHDLTQQCG